MTYHIFNHDLSILQSRRIISSIMTYQFFIQDLSILQSRLINSSIMTYQFFNQDLSILQSRLINSSVKTYQFFNQDLKIFQSRLIKSVIKASCTKTTELATWARPLPSPGDQQLRTLTRTSKTSKVVYLSFNLPIVNLSMHVGMYYWCLT